MHTLYGYRGAGSAAVEAALVIAGLPYRLVEAASWDPKSAVDELRRLNPLAQIPTLVRPDGTVMTESAAILLTLGLEHPRSRLLPEDPATRAQAIRGLVDIAANGYAAISVGDYPERWTTSRAASARAQVRDAARARLHEHWDRFADRYPTQLLTLPRGRPSALGLLAAVVSRWSGTRAHLKESRPAFLACLQRIDTHPKLAAVFSRHWPG